MKCIAGKHKAGTGDAACDDCEPGKYSTYVGQTSDSYFFDITCKSDSSCSKNERCGTDGHCICNEGWSGDTCEHCAAGRYGDDCGLSCDCQSVRDCWRGRGDVVGVNGVGKSLVGAGPLEA